VRESCGSWTKQSGDKALVHHAQQSSSRAVSSQTAASCHAHPQGPATEFRPEAAADFKRQLDVIDAQMMEAASEWGVLNGMPMERLRSSGESRSYPGTAT